MVDIHTHILPSVDDGPAAIEQSIQMLVVAYESGTNDIVATPHANPKYHFRPEIVAEKIAALADAANNQPRIHYGCEFHLTFDNVEHLMENLATYTINHNQYLLVECPDHHVGQHTESVLRNMVDAGIVPIIAHPERNPVLRQKFSRIESWVELGCLLQVTAMSITGAFGNSAKTTSYRLLDEGMVHIVASDAHDPVNRNPRLSEAREAVRARCGQEAADLVFVDTPRAVIAGAPVPGGKQINIRRPTRWYHFLSR